MSGQADTPYLSEAVQVCQQGFSHPKSLKHSYLLCVCYCECVYLGSIVAFACRIGIDSWHLLHFNQNMIQLNQS